MRISILTLIFTLLFYSCEKSATEETTLTSQSCKEPELDCTNIKCFAYYTYFDFRLVDKTTGADLVFGSDPRYSASDIQLFADPALTSRIALTADNAQKLFRVQFAQSEMYLVVKSTQLYKMNAEFRAIDCCSGRVKTLSVNSQAVCTCCGDAIQIGI